MIDPAAIDAAVLALLDDDEALMGTLKKRIEDSSEITNPNVVKVVTDRDGDASIFRGRRFRMSGAAAHQSFQTYRPVRVPARFPAGVPGLPVGPLEQAERLEQLRALENGYRIRVVETEYESWAWIRRKIWSGSNSFLR